MYKHIFDYKRSSESSMHSSEVCVLKKLQYNEVSKCTQKSSIH